MHPSDLSPSMIWLGLWLVALLAAAAIAILVQNRNRRARRRGHHRPHRSSLAKILFSFLASLGLLLLASGLTWVMYIAPNQKSSSDLFPPGKMDPELVLLDVLRLALVLIPGLLGFIWFAVTLIELVKTNPTFRRLLTRPIKETPFQR